MEAIVCPICGSERLEWTGKRVRCGACTSEITQTAAGRRWLARHAAPTPAVEAATAPDGPVDGSDATGPVLEAPRRPQTGPTRPAATGSTEPDYAELERLARQATPGPWQQVSVSDNNDRWTVRHAPTGSSLFVGGRVRSEDDAAYIAALSPDVVLRLLARRAPGDRDTERIAELSAARDKWRARAADCMEARALAADSRPEQPARDREP